MSSPIPLMYFSLLWNQNFDHDLPVLHSPTQWPLPWTSRLLAGSVAASICWRIDFLS